MHVIFQFKELNYAYEILSNADKRYKYDQCGFEGLDDDDPLDGIDSSVCYVFE